MDPALKNLRHPLQCIPVQNTVSVGHFKTNIFGKVPIDHGCYPPEFASFNTAIIKIEIGKSKNSFNRSPTAMKDRFFNRYKCINAGLRTISPGFTCQYIGHCNITSKKCRVVRRRRCKRMPKDFCPMVKGPLV